MVNPSALAPMIHDSTSAITIHPNADVFFPQDVLIEAKPGPPAPTRHDSTSVVTIHSNTVGSIIIPEKRKYERMLSQEPSIAGNTQEPNIAGNSLNEK